MQRIKTPSDSVKFPGKFKKKVPAKATLRLRVYQAGKLIYYTTLVRETPLAKDHIASMNNLATKAKNGPSPISMTRPKVWSEEVEEAYRFQLAGYRDATEYNALKSTQGLERWPHNGFIKKLQRKDGCFYYFNKTRECPEKEINKCKLYAY